MAYFATEPARGSLLGPRDCRRGVVRTIDVTDDSGPLPTPALVTTVEFGRAARFRFLRAVDETWWRVVPDNTRTHRWAALPDGTVSTVHRDDLQVMGLP